ncbi:energy transducer TonB [Segatella salivae]|uniref:TonB protein, C-terminal domain protein n=1 Tax=Segatella salivae F0493 TaxID=1395125 RepID=U2L2U3_9BACT|nr:energy transducer TonB [Segatella salivae]ERJ98660.1 TonB protein, C-terminal domain protein [Segatella salivae F0493]
MKTRKNVSLKVALMMLVLLFSFMTSTAQTKKNNMVYDVVEVMPQFPGGQIAMMKYIMENIKYPKQIMEEGIQGRVTVSFIVEKDGRVSNVRLLRSVQPSLDKEAIRVVKSMPKWTPGKHNGKPVRVRFNLPVMFKLN